MGRFVLMMKRWWVIAVVVVLSLSLTSCSGKKQPWSLYGFGYCDSDQAGVGSFDVYVIPAETSSDLYELRIVPAALNPVNGVADPLTIGVANSAQKARVMVNTTYGAVNEEIYAGTLSTQELETYEFLIISPFQAGVDFLSGDPTRDAKCYLPLPGDGTVQQ